jgi:hypothetical protein
VHDTSMDSAITLSAADSSGTHRRLSGQRARLAVRAYGCSTSSATYRDHRSAVSAETDGHVVAFVGRRRHQMKATSLAHARLLAALNEFSRASLLKVIRRWLAAAILFQPASTPRRSDDD